MAYVKSSIVITFFSASAGVGKTFLAINTAAEIARRGHSVCLVDLDLQFGDVCNYLKITPDKTILDAQNALNADNFNINDFVAEYRYRKTAFSVLPAPVDIQEIYSIDVKKLIAGMNNFKFVIIDTANNFGSMNRAVLDISTLIIFVGVNDFVPAVKNFKIGYDELCSFNYNANKIRLLHNRADLQDKILAEGVEEIIGNKFNHSLPNDVEAAKDSIDFGYPLLLEFRLGKLSTGLQEFIDKITGQKTKITKIKNPNTGIINRMKNFFAE